MDSVCQRLNPGFMQIGDLGQFIFPYGDSVFLSVNVTDKSIYFIGLLWRLSEIIE